MSTATSVRRRYASPTGRFKGPFRTNISEGAEQLDFELLDDEEKRQLARGLRFDPEQFEVYRFFVVLQTLLEATQPSFFDNLAKRIKRQSIDRADRVLIRLQPISRDVRFVGIHPTSRERDGQTSFDLSGEVMLSVNIKVFRLQVIGKAKDLARKKKTELLAARTDSSAEWIFLRPYIEANTDFRLQFCCVVPKDLQPSARYMLCETTVESGKRVLDAKRKRIAFRKV